MTKPITIQRQADAVRREIAFRQRVYPRFIDQGKLTPEKAAEEIAAMEAVLETLKGIIREREPQLL